MGPGGVLARSLGNFEYRESQVRMARLVKEAFETEDHLVVEAGTGTGKTLGYLVPVFLSGKKTVISTGTKNLQEQIFFKDIPLLSRATGQSPEAVLMKGRKNYLCLHRYHSYISRPTLFKTERERLEKTIGEWLRETEFADRAELAWLADDAPLWEALSASSEQCLGVECLYLDQCYLNALRRKAARSRIVIVNHHLFFADLRVRQQGFGEILPRFQALVFDEAHGIEEIATTYFGEQLSTGQLMDFADEVEKDCARTARDRPMQRHLNLIRTGAEGLRECVSGGPEKGRIDPEVRGRMAAGPARLIREGLNYLLNDRVVAEDPPPLFGARARDLSSRVDAVLSCSNPGTLLWYERRRRSLVIHVSPLEIAQDLQRVLYDRVKTVVFTSATLSTNGNFSYIRKRLGLQDRVPGGIFSSHFDYQEKALLYVPMDLPTPPQAAFPEEVAERILEILHISAGRALVLFTSYHNLNTVYSRIEGRLPYTLLRQGDNPKSVLLDAFREDIHSVLMATGSFWQGIDVPGQALSCLIVDKLPFDSPGEPLVSARIDAIRAAGGNPFTEYQLPSAIIALKQGLGRLIRNNSDRGLLAVMDSRLINSRYGRVFLDSMPKMQLTHDLSDLRRFFGSPEGTSPLPADTG